MRLTKQEEGKNITQKKRAALIIFLILGLLFVFIAIQYNRKNIVLVDFPNDLPDKDIVIVIEPTSHNDNMDLVYQPHKDNGLVHQPVEYTVINNSSKTIYFMGTSGIGGYQNPMVCKVINDSNCETLSQGPYQGMPRWGEIKPGGKMTGSTFYPLEKYKLVFRYLKEPQDVRYYEGISQGIGLMTEDEFEKKSSKIYSSTLQTEKIELTKQSTLDICNSIKNPEQCLDIYKKEFGADGYPISINKLGERQDLLIGEVVTVEGKIFLGNPDDESWPGPFTIWALLNDINREGYEPGGIFLYENGDFIFCDAPQNYVPVCKNWINGKSYRITGRLRKGLLKRTDASDSYYLDVKNKESIN